MPVRTDLNSVGGFLCLSTEAGFPTHLCCLLKPDFPPSIFQLVLRIMLQCVVNSENPAFVSDQKYTSSPLAQTGLVQGRFRALGDLALPLGGEDV